MRDDIDKYPISGGGVYILSVKMYFESGREPMCEYTINWHLARVIWIYYNNFAREILLK